MEISQLHAIIAVAEEGGFNKAAEKLHIAQSAISRKIAHLESELNEKLFLRTPKKVYLTPAGETFLRYARRISQDLRNVSVEVSKVAQLKQGRLRIGAGMTACLYILPAMLEKFTLLYPQIELQVITGTTDTLISQLHDNVLDIALITLPVGSPDLCVVPLRPEEVVVVVSIKHPTLSRKKSLVSKELTGQPMILWKKDASTRRLLDTFFNECGIVPQIRMEAENVALIKPLVGVNLGITLLPLLAVMDEVRRKELHVLRILDHKLFRKQGLVFLKADHRPRVLSELIRIAQQKEERQ